MARRLFTFDFSKYSFLCDDVDHNFRVYRCAKDITDKVMNNPLLDLLLAYNKLYEKTVFDVKNLRRGTIRNNVDFSMSVDNEDNAIHFVIKGINNSSIELLADDIYNYIDNILSD